MLRKCALCLLLALAALAAPIAAQADSPPQPLPADGKCAVPADPNWTKQEQFVWLNVCVGKEMDFNREPGYGGDLDPKSPTGLPDSRIPRSSFLETILLKNRYRSVLSRLGVRITGARFTETVDLQNAELEHDFWLDRCLLEKGAKLFGAQTSHQIRLDGSKIFGFNLVESEINKDLSIRGTEFSENINLSEAHIGGRLDLSSSTVTGTLYMNGIRIDQSLFVRDKAQFNEIELAEAHIGGQLDLSSSTVTGMLYMNGIRVDQSLFMRDRAEFEGINLSGAHIGGQFDLSSSTVTGLLNMNGIRVDQSLFMRDKARFKEINLAGAHIGGQLDLSSSTVTGKLEGDYIDVAQTIYLGRGATFADEIDLTSAKVGQDLSLSGGIFNRTVDLTGARFNSILGLDSAHWLGHATLDLTSAAADRINLSDSWPDRTYASDFTYHNLSNTSRI